MSLYTAIHDEDNESIPSSSSSVRFVVRRPNPGTHLYRLGMEDVSKSTITLLSGTPCKLPFPSFITIYNPFCEAPQEALDKAADKRRQNSRDNDKFNYLICLEALFHSHVLIMKKGANMWNKAIKDQKEIVEAEEMDLCQTLLDCLACQLTILVSDQFYPDATTSREAARIHKQYYNFCWTSVRILNFYFNELAKQDDAERLTIFKVTVDQNLLAVGRDVPRLY